MFTASEFRLIRKICSEDFENLLRKLNIEQPSFNEEDEFDIYKNLDEEISNRICKILHSEDIISGYFNLLRVAQISFDFSESEKNLLKKILHAESNIRTNCIELETEESIESEEVVEKIPTLDKIEIPLPNIFEAMYLLRGHNEKDIEGIPSTKVKSIKIVIEYETLKIMNYIKKKSLPIKEKSLNDDLKKFSGEELDQIFDILRIINDIEEKI